MKHIGRMRISAVKNESFKDSRYAKANVGESIQSVAIGQIYKSCNIDESRIAIVDRFKTGQKFGVPIVHGDQVANYKPDHICISTRPGLDDAINGCKKLYGERYMDHYTILSSRQES